MASCRKKSQGKETMIKKQAVNKKVLAVALMLACVLSCVLLASCSSGSQHQIMTSPCEECEEKGVETFEVERPAGSVTSSGTIIVQADEPVYLCNPVFTSKNGSSYIPYAISRYNMVDGEVKVHLSPGTYAFCLDRGDSSIGKVVVVSEESTDTPEIKLK